MVEDDSGIALDDNFDFLIDNSGDVGSYSNVQEMHKDLAGLLSAYIDQEVSGDVLTNNKIVEIESGVSSILNNDDRIQEIITVSVRKNRRRNLAQIEITVDSIYGGLEFNVD